MKVKLGEDSPSYFFFSQSVFTASVQGFFSKFLMGGTQNFWSPSVPDGDEVGWGGLGDQIIPTCRYGKNMPTTALESISQCFSDQCAHYRTPYKTCQRFKPHYLNYTCTSKKPRKIVSHSNILGTLCWGQRWQEVTWITWGQWQN